MLFKGTKERGTKEIMDMFSNMGVEFNAFTDKNMTGYVAKCNSVYLGEVINIYGDLLRNSVIDEEEMENEKNVVIEELKRIHDNPIVYLSDLMAKEIYKGSRLAETIGGNYKTLKGYSREDVKEYYKRNYVRENMVISVISNIEIGEIKRMIRGSEIYRIRRGRKSEQKGGEIEEQEGVRYTIHSRDDLEQIQIGIGFRTIDMYDEGQFISDYVNVILAGNMNSRLFMELRERNGLSYSINIDDTAYEKGGNFTIMTSIDKDKIFNYEGKEGGINIIMRVIEEIRRDGISEEEYENARNYLKGSMILELEDSLALATYNCKQNLFNIEPRVYYKDLLKRYERIGIEEINEWIRENLRYEKMTIGLVGGIKKKGKVKRKLERIVERLIKS